MHKHPTTLKTWLYRRRSAWPYAVMAILTMCILGPLYRRGYVLQYDMLFAPYYDIGLDGMRRGDSLWQGLPYNAVLKLASWLLPMDVVQKLLLSGILLVSMIGVYRLLPRLKRSARLLAAGVYTCNPFVYDRLLAGHWRFLIAYALTPLVLQAFWRLMQRPSGRAAFMAALWWTLAVWANSHHTVIIGVLFLGCAGMLVRTRRAAVYAAVSLVWLALLNSWWLLPGLTGNTPALGFGVEQFEAFRTKGDMVHGLWFTMLGLHGFWYETGWRHIKDFYSLWPVVLSAWLLPVYIGAGRLAATKGLPARKALALGAAALAGLIFASGPAEPFSVLNTWLFGHVPGLSGLREPQKLLALLALFYAFMAAYGFNALLARPRRWYRLAALAMAGVGLACMVRPFWWGMQGQWWLTQYPSSWYSFRRELVQRDVKVLVLPWELYVDRTLTRTVVANPAIAFYGDRAVVSTRMMLPGVVDSERDCGAQVTQAVGKKSGDDMAKAAKTCGTRYIMVTENFEHGQYKWLESSKKITIHTRGEKLLIFKIDN